MSGNNIYLYDKDIICPICGKKFKTKKVKSNSIKILNRETDFRTEYEFEDPTFYGIDVCLNCGHARFESDFSDVNESSKQLIQKNISARWKSKNYCNERSINDAIEVHKLALLNYNITNYRFLSIGKVCLRLVWFYRNIDTDLEEKFIKHTIDTYEKAYLNESFEKNPKEELLILYLLGELNRRMGNFQKSMDWFSLGVKNELIKTDKFINEKLRNQMHETKKQYKKLKEEGKTN